MQLTNVSKIGLISVLAIDQPDGVEYWTGGTEFHKDIVHANQLGCGAAMHWMTKLNNRGFNVRCVTHPDGDIQLIHWQDIGWVVVNHRNWPVTVHRAYYTGAYGEGWFMEGEGSIERKLCINRPNHTYMDITVRGRDIVGVEFRVEGETFDKWGTLSIPCDSELAYQFGFDPTPLDL